MKSGVASWPRLVSKSAYQASPRLFTFPVLIFVSGLKRCSSVVRPRPGHWPSSFEAAVAAAPQSAQVIASDTATPARRCIFIGETPRTEEATAPQAQPGLTNDQ